MSKYNSKIWILTIFHLRMTIVKILASSGRTVPCTQRLLHLLKLYLDVINISVHSHKINFFINQRTILVFRCITTDFSLGPV